MAIFDMTKAPIKETMNFRVPPEGPKAIPLYLDFTAAGEYDIDLTTIETNGQFSMVQTIYVDNSSTASAMSIVFPDIQQTIVANGHTEGYYPVLGLNPTHIQISSAANAILIVHLINSPIPGVVWAATHP